MVQLFLEFLNSAEPLYFFVSGNLLVMKIEVDENFSFEKKARMDANNDVLMKWENLMSEFQQPFPWAKKGEKWVLVEPIFQF